MALAKIVNKLRKKRIPKNPKKNAPKSAWDNCLKKKKEVIAFNKAVNKESKRRAKIAAMK